MKMIKYFFLLVLFHCAYVNADTLPQWTINPGESNLSFSATQNNAPVTGSFKEFTGTVFADLTHYENSSVDIVVNINSLTTAYSELTTILLSADWFNAKEFPKAEFKSTKFTKKDDKHFEANGTLTIKNKSVPITVAFTAVESPKNHLLVEGNTVIKRTAFNIGQGDWASTTEIKDDVTVNFKIAASRKE